MTSNKPEMDFSELIEQLAEMEHNRWAGWHRHAKKNWTPERVDRWDSLASTAYPHLSEDLKEKDRVEVRRFWPMILDAIKAAERKGFAAGEIQMRERAAKEVETHWNDSGTGVNQKAQALRSARVLRDLPITGALDAQ